MERNCSKRAFPGSTSPQTSKVFKIDRISKLGQHIPTVLSNMETHISASLYKLSQHKYGEVQKVLEDVCSMARSLDCHVGNEVKECKLEFVSLTQRVHGLESNKQYLLREMGKKEDKMKVLEKNVERLNEIILALSGECEDPTKVDNPEELSVEHVEESRKVEDKRSD